MVIIGQKLNSIFPEAQKALERRDQDAVLRLAGTQKESGADYLEISAQETSDEKAALCWAVKLMTQTVPMPLVLDVSDGETVDYVFSACGPVKDCVLGSVTPGIERFDSIMGAVLRYGTGVAARPAPFGEAPLDGRGRTDVLRDLVQDIAKKGISFDRILVNLASGPAQTAWRAPKDCVKAARALRDGFPGIHIGACIPAVSEGMPHPGILNASYAAALAAAGADTFILDPTDTEQMLSCLAAETVLGLDERASRYIAFCTEIAEM